MSESKYKITYHGAGDQKLTTYLFRRSYDTIDNVKDVISSLLFDEHQLPRTELRIYWIDEDKDEVEICAAHEFIVFVDMMTPLHRSIWRLHVAPIIPAPEKTVETLDPTFLSIHDHVECAGCDANPIIGFRYKCIQCPNYDLCQKCEAKHLHAEHMLVRMPNPHCPSIIEKPAAETTAATDAAHVVKNLIAACVSNFEAGVQAFVMSAKNAAAAAQTAAAFAGPLPKTPASTPNDGENSTKNDNTVPVAPSFENLAQFFDPQFMKTGVQILNNFSEMFAKMLDPADGGSSPIGDASQTPASRRSQNEDWQLIDKQTSSPPNATTATTSANEASTEINYVKLSKDLKAHVDQEQTREEEAKKQDTPIVKEAVDSTAEASVLTAIPIERPASVSTPAETASPVPTARTLPESPRNLFQMNGVPVFHPDQRINNAALDMMAMGAWLAQLLESVNGNIPETLDLMRAAHRNK